VTTNLRADLYRSAVDGQIWTPLGNPRVEASWISDLVVGRQLPSMRRPVHAKGVRLRGVTIEGQMDLDHAQMVVPLMLDDIEMDEILVMTNASGVQISVTNSVLAGVQANSLRLSSSLDLSGSKVASVVDLDGVEIRRDIILGHGFVASEGVKLGGASIGNQLRCEGGTFKNPRGPALFADNAQVTHGVFLSRGFAANGEVRFGGASLGHLTCSGGRFENPRGLALFADDLRVSGGIYLDNGFVAFGEVRLAGADIDGQISCSAGVFHNPGGMALLAESMRVRDMLFLDDGFVAQGEVRLTNVVIGGKLGCIGGTFSNAGAMALNCASARVSGSVDLADGFTSEGEVRFSSAAVGGDLYCLAGSFNNPGGIALIADGATVSGSVVLEHGFTSAGSVVLRGASIRGQLTGRGGTFTNGIGPSLSADGAEVVSGVFLDHGFTSHGEVRLVGASVGILSCDGGRFTNQKAVAFRGDKLEVSKGASFSSGFTSFGEVRLAGAAIGGQLSFRDGALNNDGGIALIADGATVAWDVVMDNGFRSVGEVRLQGMAIGGQISCNGAVFTHEGHIGLTLHSTTVAGIMSWQPAELTPGTAIDLRSASIGLLRDDLMKWPAPGMLWLDGFTYSGIDQSTEVQDRIEWIERSQPYKPQPYEQLASWYQNAGNDVDARRVRIEKEKARNVTIPGWWRKTLHTAWGLLTSYGYRPAQSLVIFAVALLLAGVFYTWAGESGAMKPADPTASGTVIATVCTSTYPCYQPFLYAADVMIPIVDLDQRDVWSPDAAHAGANDRLLPWSQGETVRVGTVVLIFVGWVLTVAMVASLGQTIYRD